MSVLKYLGGAHLPNVPARDLTESDLERLQELHIGRQALLDSGLYQAVSTETVKKKAAPPQERENDEVNNGISE